MKKRSLAMAVLVVAQFMDLMDAMITNVALPSIRRDLGATDAQLEWTLTGYILAFAVVLITGGRLGDLFGRRHIFLIGVTIFTLASIGAAAAHSGGELVTTRIIQGAAAALMVPQVLATAQVLFEPHERGKIFGLMSALGGVGVLTGQLLGGWLVVADIAGLGWRSIFLINVPVGVAILIATRLLVPETRAERGGRLDGVGVVLLSATVFSLVFPLTVGNSVDWAWWTWGLIGVAIVLAVAFVAVERRRGDLALLPPRLFRSRGFAVGSLVQLAYQVGWGSFALMLGLYTQEALHFSALEAGLVMVPVTVGSFIGTALAPFAARIGRPAVIIGAGVQMLGFVAYAIVLSASGAALGVWSLALPLGIAGVGMILLAVPLMGLAVAQVDTDQAGAASGAFAMFQQLGYAIGIAVAGIAFFGVIGSHAPQAVYQQAIVLGNVITVIAFAAAGVAAIALPARVKSRAPEQTLLSH
ncbi:MFS transporter [Saxibacter everestensis]|uniref:MFS transporter n=1 Tax=Saxibacter everestensis TaxID=2909229 RepID=A0ABY8QW74_9MICO|nr:MFS transporter [Brevibacteriaceae bacterium ZFBP1038]